MVELKTRNYEPVLERKPQAMQNNSVAAYHDNDNMHRALKKKAIYNVICVHQPVTNKEIAQLTGYAINTVTPRVLELRREGLVIAGPQKFDFETNATSISWITKHAQATPREN